MRARNLRSWLKQFAHHISAPSVGGLVTNGLVDARNAKRGVQLLNHQLPQVALDCELQLQVWHLESRLGR